MRKWASSLILSVVGFLLLLAVPVHAQRLCEAIVANALEAAGENCKNLKGDQACYGYNTLNPTFYDAMGANTLQTQGSSVELPVVHILAGAAYDEEEDEWGIGYLQLWDGEFEDGESVRIILMGDVTVENAIEPSDEEFGYFEIIYVTTGEDSDCQEAVNDMVLQAPKGTVGRMYINDVPVTFGSTVVFGWDTENGDDVMYVTVLDGEVVVDADTPNEQVIGMREVSLVAVDSEEPILDALTGEPVLDADGNPVMRRFMGEGFSDSQPLTADGEGFRSLEYYRTFEQIPEELLNYPIDLEAEEELCECEFETADTLSNDDVSSTDQCSVELSNTEVTATLTNNSNAEIDVMWLDSDCIQEYYFSLSPGEGTDFASFPGHDWEVLQNGASVMQFTIGMAGGTYTYP